MKIFKFFNKNLIPKYSLKKIINYQKFSIASKEDKNETKSDDEEELDKFSIKNLTSSSINELITQIENKIENNYLLIHTTPVSNYFGEVPLYVAPIETFNRKQNCEKSGFLLLSTITAFNYLGLLYPPTLFPYFAVLTLTALFKITTKGGQKSQIILMTMINDKKVRCMYLNGHEEIVDVKNMIYNQNDRFNSMLMDTKKNEAKASVKEEVKQETDEEKKKKLSERNRMLMFTLAVNNQKKFMILRTNIMPYNKNPIANLAFADTFLLLAVINKKMKRFVFEGNPQKNNEENNDKEK